MDAVRWNCLSGIHVAPNGKFAGKPGHWRDSRGLGYAPISSRLCVLVLDPPRSFDLRQLPAGHGAFAVKVLLLLLLVSVQHTAAAIPGRQRKADRLALKPFHASFVGL